MKLKRRVEQALSFALKNFNSLSFNSLSLSLAFDISLSYSSNLLYGTYILFRLASLPLLPLSLSNFDVVVSQIFISSFISNGFRTSKHAIKPIL